MMTRTVPKFRLEFDRDFIETFKTGCEAILESDTLQEGPWVRKFEMDFGRFIGAQHCIATSSGTTALEVALRAVGVKGKEVIVPTNTFIATAIAVERAGGILKLVDIEPETYAIDPGCLGDAVSSKTGAVVLVHIGGVISKSVERIVEICRANEIPLVEDSAHAHGASRGEFRAGTIGAAAAFSFFPTKVMTCAEGGMVTTNDLAIAAKCRSIKDFGRGKREGAFSYMNGLNAKMTEFQGLLGVMDIERIRKRTGQRVDLFDEYDIGLSGTSFKIDSSSFLRDSLYKIIVRTEKENDEIRDFCSDRGVELAGDVYRYPLHQQPVFEGRFGEDFPVANEFCTHHICPPLYPEMDVEDVRYVCDVLKAAQKEL